LYNAQRKTKKRRGRKENRKEGKTYQSCHNFFARFRIPIFWNEWIKFVSKGILFEKLSPVLSVIPRRTAFAYPSCEIIKFSYYFFAFVISKKKKKIIWFFPFTFHVLLLSFILYFFHNFRDWFLFVSACFSLGKYKWHFSTFLSPKKLMLCQQKRCTVE
jgi:hypothetical protein